MTSNLPKDAGELFHKGAEYDFEGATFYAYGVGVTTEMVQQACDDAAASYLKHISMDNPQFFTVGSTGQLQFLSDCINLYVERLRLTLDAADATHSNESLPMYPHGFIIVLDANTAMLALACKLQGNWRLEFCTIPIHIELCQAIQDLRRGNTTAQDIIVRYTKFREVRDRVSQIDNPPFNTHGWAFILFTTGLHPALPLLAMIDPAIEYYPSSEATLQLGTQSQISEQRMRQIFPLAVRDDRRRGWRTNGMMLHSKVFIYCDNDDPGMKGVAVVRVDWDGFLDRQDTELNEAFDKADYQVKRASVGNALEKALHSRFSLMMLGQLVASWQGPQRGDPLLLPPEDFDLVAEKNPIATQAGAEKSQYAAHRAPGLPLPLPLPHNYTLARVDGARRITAIGAPAARNNLPPHLPPLIPPTQPARLPEGDKLGERTQTQTTTDEQVVLSPTGAKENTELGKEE
ncbi:hypothetical protein SNK03_003846 [Fusarium graminearum]|uniref:Chromosome 1, complete genome n=1 Tax=Gibberella zeae (strain ATCC MYA-4620 / CBS 123657 / FGSC 9075 / NRRL 31084 / PH-1) TaxID=229533 RepID=I1S150_GIBZE|nr:hypothetical protein FGSG_10447 [Fusarium graminearum PH-1]EYB31392.1 hypothetical protein FG05_10447 [Fusarium graminearum]ESU17162.1 hypothetical protein FGSG_10447 [Fusarium graminearum PH-1]KAI6759822.1 hypothetical protein HG531_013728 [Fusarium graminearum]CAF3557847.1 unnamed protein product [Fusarium graminearum]CAF3615146.1 unnamed protein product [Fusarium graminearum]|eukprot:XP_011319424.1 hypothetical protein FGSG_10447 [Fusarium graminearum PH-1]